MAGSARFQGVAVEAILVAVPLVTQEELEMAPMVEDEVQLHIDDLPLHILLLHVRAQQSAT